MTKMDKFKKLAKPLVEFLQNNYDPHTTIIITDTHAKIVSDVVGIPFNGKEE